MKSIFLKVSFTDKEDYNFRVENYLEDNETSYLLTAIKAVKKAKNFLQRDNITSVTVCECRGESGTTKVLEKNKNGRIVFKDVLDSEKEYPVTLEMCDGILSKFNIKEYLPKIEGEPLEILPYYYYNEELQEYCEKLRKEGKCTDWTKLDQNLECSNVGGWYLHGTLEDKVRYDLGVIINANKAGVTKDSLYWHEIRHGKCLSYDDKPYKRMHLNGIRHCKVIGVSDNCIGFFYTDEEYPVTYDKGEFLTWKQRGYVVEADDLDGLLDAYTGYLIKLLD